MKNKILSVFATFFLLTLCAAWCNPSGENSTVSFLGPEGTYTEEATLNFFGGNANLTAKKTVDAAIADVVSGSSDFAVIPQENTIGGAVTNYVDALIRSKDVFVVGEIMLPISQTLMGVSGATLEAITTVCSHAQGLSQSETWRKEHLPNARTLEMPSTAAAARYVSEQKDTSIAAVASSGAARLYGLTILAENVQISTANKTRFYVLSKKENLRPSLKNAVIVLEREVGEIPLAIGKIHKSGLEIVSLHDRPQGSHIGRYYFVIEVKNSKGITKKQISLLKRFENARFYGCFDVKEKDPATAGIDYMALVNKTHPLPDGWEGKLATVHVTNTVGDDVEVEKKPTMPTSNSKPRSKKKAFL